MRKSKRLSANIRQEHKTPEARHIHRQEYAEFLDASTYYPDIFQRMIDKISILIDNSNSSIEAI